ncbi:hypothetical protein G5B47_13175 [Paenibacillus sp. 7124]|uniref:Uncharacterized protein n=1 Tax=Paenibacillus apii TaxID=1850370 RepID=A0A6M1PIU9_9BACL|nr:hypothetical protein [Paenibacillus apii]NGM83369.1 hypothetical protein [Paenibacillus apii]NJJ39018.1 hypothetical protein [Paenibacillus apii]
MNKRQLGLAAVFAALLIAASGCIYPGGLSTAPALPDSMDVTNRNPGKGLGEEGDPLAPVLQDVYTKSIPEDVYTDR